MWRTEWRAVSDSIEGLKDAANFHFQHLTGKDTYGVSKKILLPISASIRQNILSFNTTYQNVLSDSACNALRNILIGKLSYSFHDDFTNKLDSGIVIQAQIVSFVAFKTEFSYAISDLQSAFKKMSERAFIHLQRTLVADEAIRERWQKAFDKGETYCEKLGAVHLLQFGIWAFKANSEGERTDIIFQEVLSDISIVEQTADALVLTEWKLVKTEKELNNAIKSARKQALLYSKGSLAGIELSNYRYLVIVSNERMPMPPDEKFEETTFRHINVPIKPATPSKTQTL